MSLLLCAVVFYSLGGGACSSCGTASSLLACGHSAAASASPSASPSAVPSADAPTAPSARPSARHLARHLAATHTAPPADRSAAASTASSTASSSALFRRFAPFLPVCGWVFSASRVTCRVCPIRGMRCRIHAQTRRLLFCFPSSLRTYRRKEAKEANMSPKRQKGVQYLCLWSKCEDLRRNEVSKSVFCRCCKDLFGVVLLCLSARLKIHAAVAWAKRQRR